MDDAHAALQRLCDAEAKVSAHYLIMEDGTLYQMVEEAHTAWHAGISQWGDIVGLNTHSIGIEISHPGEHTQKPYTEAQYLILETLLAEIMHRHAIPPHHVLAHSDVAPSRKDDPGTVFDWSRLEAKNLAAPWSAYTQAATPQEALHLHGYRGEETHVITAFQRRYVPGKVSGMLCPHTVAFIMGQNSHEKA